MPITQAPPERMYQGGPTMPNTRADTGNPPLEGGEPAPPFAEPPIPVTLLDLDATGADYNQPCPPELVQFVYDNCQEGPVTLWSALLTEPDGSTVIWSWFGTAEALWRARSLQMQLAPASDEKPSGDHITEITWTAGAPVHAATTHRSRASRDADVSGGADTKVSGTAPKEGAARRNP